MLRHLRFVILSAAVVTLSVSGPSLFGQSSSPQATGAIASEFDRLHF